MKKTLWNAEKFILKYTFKESEQEKIVSHIFEFDLKQNIVRNRNLGTVAHFIPTDKAFLEYRFGQLYLDNKITKDEEGIFSINITIWDRLTGKRFIYSDGFSFGRYKKIKIKLDKINSKIKNYKKDLSWGTFEKYEVSNLGTFDQEMKKYNILFKYANEPVVTSSRMHKVPNEYALWELEKIIDEK